jgi:hypothetical protein
MTSEEKLLHLQTMPLSWLRHELFIRLNQALSGVPFQERQKPIIQLLENRLYRKQYSSLISLWPKLEKDFPHISSILSDYDYQHQQKQLLIIRALEQAIRAII